MTNPNQEKNQSPEITIPELTQLTTLQSSVAENNLQSLSNLNTLKDNIANSVISLDVNQIEEISTAFVWEELQRSGLLSQIEVSNTKASSLLEQIKFFSNDSSYLTGFLSHDFSQEDEEKWIAIEQALADVYDSNQGLLKKVQDYFLFQVEREQIMTFLNVNNLTLEEELFIRSVLVKGYLNNLRQLLLPFYEISDDILIKFKKDRLQSLKNNRISGSNVSEIKLLEEQIQKLELQTINHNSHRVDSQKRFSVTADTIAAYNTQLNTSSVVLGTVETVRYMTSFVGHSTGVELLKTVGNLGLKSTNLLAKCLPVVSVLAEAGTQMNNNRVVYNYEKKLKILSILDNTKRSLLIHEQGAVDYYLDNVLNRLQSIMMDNQINTRDVVLRAYDDQLALHKQSDVEEQVELVKEEYFQNVELVRRGVEQVFQAKVDEKDELISTKDKALENKDKALSEKDEVIRAKETRLSELDQELFDLNLELEQKRKQLDREIADKSKQITSLNNSIVSLSENLSFTRELLEKEKESLCTKEKALQESLKGNLNASLQAAYDYEVSKRQELEATLNIFLQKQSKLQDELNITETNLSTKVKELESEQENWEALNEKLTYERDVLKREKLLIEEKRKELDQERKVLSSKLNGQEKTLSKLSDGYAKLKADVIILEDALKKAKASVADEIEKCNRYRKQIRDLELKERDLIKLQSEFKTLEQSNHINQKQIADLKKERLNIVENQKKLISDCNDWQAKYKQLSQSLEQLQKQSFFTKVKLISVLSLDTARSFLPQSLGGFQIQQGINSFATILLASEVTGKGNSVAWAIWGGGILIFTLYGFWKLVIANIIYLGKKFRGFFHGFSRDLEDTQTNKEAVVVNKNSFANKNSANYPAQKTLVKKDTTG